MTGVIARSELVSSLPVVNPSRPCERCLSLSVLLCSALDLSWPAELCLS